MAQVFFMLGAIQCKFIAPEIQKSPRFGSVPTATMTSLKGGCICLATPSPRLGQRRTGSAAAQLPAADPA
jgi:hypothetical protein